MILKSLYLKNYRTYRGPEEIYFATGDKNVTIIQGNNEVGKTTIMNAITWCLYGVEYYKNEGNEPIFSKSTSYDLENGDKDFVEVKIHMEDSKGKDITFIRTLEFYKNDLGEAKEGSEEYDIYVDDLPVSFKSNYINTHLPKDVREYFLFDGEQLEKYFDEDNKNIKKSVYQLSQLNLLKRAKNHVSSRIIEFNDDLIQLNPSLGKYKKEKTTLEEKISNKEYSLKDIEKNLKKWKDNIVNLESEIKEFGKNPEALLDEKANLKKQRDQLDSTIETDKKNYVKFLLLNFPKIFSIENLMDVKLICQDLEEKGYIPARFKKEFLEYLLEQHECICGADLSEGTDGYSKMKELYEQTDETTNIADSVNILLGSVNSIINNFPENFDTELINKNNKMENDLDKRDEIAKNITDIDNLLGTDAEEKIRELQKSINSYENLITYNTEKKGRIKKELEDNRTRLSLVKEKIIEEEGKAGQKTDIERSIAFAESLRDELTRIYEELENNIHDRLQKLTSEEFGKMHWKEFYDGVSIDEDFNVVIHKEGGDIVPNDLSKGGQLVLALSFMTALNSLSGFELPILIDTPLGRLDEPIKKNIGEYLPIYTKNKQVTLLVTSSEYSEGFKMGVKPYIGKEYSLNYIQEKDGITTIETRYGG